MEEHKHSDHKPFWLTPLGWVFIGFVLIGGFFLIAEHSAHVFGVLPYFLILLCPLMHFFGHGGHGRYGGHQKTGASDASDKSNTNSKGGAR